MVRALLSHSPHIRKRGRPPKIHSGPDYGTHELRLKRHALDTHEIQLNGTIASILIKNDLLSLSHVEDLQKIYILRRRYMNLLECGSDVRSQNFQTLSLGKTFGKNSAHHREQRENLMLEHTWKELRSYLRAKHNGFLNFLDHLFRLYSYETLEEASFLFRSSFPRDFMIKMAGIAHDALHL